MIRRIFAALYCLMFTFHQAHGSPALLPPPLPEKIALDVNLAVLIQISPSSLPVLNPADPSLMLASYATNPSAQGSALGVSGTAAHNATYPATHLNTRVNSNSCSSAGCGSASGLHSPVSMRSEFSTGEIRRPATIVTGNYSKGGSTPSPNYLSSGPETSSAMMEYSSAQSEFSGAQQELSSANNDLLQARNSYEAAASSLVAELALLAADGARYNSAVSGRNSAASNRNAAASETNAAKQAHHNAVTHNTRVRADIVKQDGKKKDLEKKLVELPKELDKRATETAQQVTNVDASERTDNEMRETNRNIENQAIDSHNQFSLSVNESSRLREGVDSIRNFLDEAKKPGSRENLSTLPSSPASPGYVAPVFANANSVPAGFNSHPGDRVAVQCGSIVRIDSLALGEQIPLSGVPFSLYYFTDRSRGRLGDYQIHFPLRSDADGDVTQIGIELSIAGRTLNQNLIGTQKNFDLVWNGRNRMGGLSLGKAPFEATITLRKSDGSNITRKVSSFAGNYNPDFLGLGGWGVSLLHFYSVAESKVYFGNGTSRLVLNGKLLNGNYLVPSEDGGEVYLFNSQGLHFETRHGLTGSLLYRFSYLEDKRLAVIEDSFRKKSTFTYSQNSVSIRGPYGVQTSLSLNSDGQLESVTNPAGDAYRLKYHASRLLTEFVKPEGQTSSFYYDELGYLTGDKNAAGQFVSYRATPHLSVPNQFDVQSITSEGRVTSYTLTTSKSGDVHRLQKSPDGISSQSEYRPGDFEKWRSTSEVIETKYSEDIRFGKSVNFASLIKYSIPGTTKTLDTSVTQSISRESGPRDYFDFYSLKTLVNKNGRTTQIAYDQRKRETTMTSAAGRISVIRMTEHGEPLSIQRANLAPTRYEYDDLGRPSSIAKGDQKTTYRYDKDGNLTSSTTSAGTVLTYGYDRAGRMISTMHSDGRLISYSYDRNGNLTSIAPPDRPAHRFQIGLLENILSYNPPSKSEPSAVLYSYNGDNQLTQIKFADGKSVHMSYGKTSGHLEEISSEDGQFRFEYGENSALQKVVSPDGVHTTFDQIGKLPQRESSTLPGGALNQLLLEYNDQFLPANISLAVGDDVETVKMTYDLDGLLTQAGDAKLYLNAQNGLLEQLDLGNISELFVNDLKLSVPSSRIVRFGNSSDFIFKEILVRDKLGQVQIRFETQGSEEVRYEYYYDSEGRIWQTVVDGKVYGAYSYDRNGNREIANIDGRSYTASFDEQDRVINHNTTLFAYDAQGNLQQKKNTLTGEVDTFHYDRFGNLKHAELANRPRIEYVVDGLNRRVAKKVDGKTVEQYVYLSQLQIAAVLDGHNQVVSRFVYGSRANIPDYMIREGRNYKIVADYLGSPRMVVDAESGKIVQKMKFDEFGRVLEDTNPGFQPFGFAGGLYDTDTKLVRFGARDYDPETGRWTSKDPILFDGGDTNLYGYVLNDPVNFVDSDGKNPVVAGIVTGFFLYFNSSQTDTPGAGTREILSGAATIGLGALGGLGGSSSAGAFCSASQSGLRNGIATEFTAHGAKRAAERGISNTAIDKALSSSIGATAGAGRFSNTVTVFGKNGINVVISTSGQNAGKIITVFPK